MRQIVYFMGDVHGAFGRLNEFIDREIRKRDIFRYIAEDCRKSREKFEVMIIQAGDFAYYWPGWNNAGKIDNRVDFLPEGLVKIHWIGGNHEDWDEIESRLSGRDFAETSPGVFLHNFGSTMTMADGQIMLFCGGAESADRDARIMKMMQGEGKCWWKNEGITDSDMERLKFVPKADIIVSHTAPLAFDVSHWLVGNGYWHIRHDNTSRERLDAVFKKYRPKKWFFGHFHERMEGKAKGCEWIGLSSLENGHDAWQSMDFQN